MRVLEMIENEIAACTTKKQLKNVAHKITAAQVEMNLQPGYFDEQWKALQRKYAEINKRT